MSKPTDYREWRARRNNIAMSLCSAVSRARSGVCSCYNGDSDPDTEHFDSCKKNVSVADEALAALGVPVPARFKVEPKDNGIVVWDERQMDSRVGYRISPVGSWFYTNNRGKLWAPIKDSGDIPQQVMDALAEHDKSNPVSVA